MRAVARIVARASRIAVLRSEPPILLRQSGATLVHVLSGAAGPLGGDDLRLEIEVHEGAVLHVHGVAASIALPSASNKVSRMTVAATVAEGGELRWFPEPLIAAARCRHEAVSTVDLTEGARLLWREELICGRHSEAPGDATVAMSLTYARKPLLRQALRVGPEAPAWDGPGVLAGAKTVGCLIGVGHAEPATAMRLAGGVGWMVTAIGRSGMLTPAR